MKASLANVADRVLSLPGIRNRYLDATRHVVPILLFHRAADAENGIGGYQPSAIERYLDQVRAADIQVLGLEELVERYRAGRGVSRPSIAFTADDGYEDQGSVLGEVFAQRELPLTIFLITDFVDGSDWPWDAKIHYAFRQTASTAASIPVGSLVLDFDLSSERARVLARREFQLICKSLPPESLSSALDSLSGSLDVVIPASPPAPYRPMSWQQARDLEGRGITFAPHSCSHRVFSCLPEEDVRKEMELSWQRVSAELRRPLKAFAWPVGQDHDFGPREDRIARAIGFDATLAARHRYSIVRRGEEPATLERIGFGAGHVGESMWRATTGIRRLGLRNTAKSMTRSASDDRLGGLAIKSNKRFGRRVRARALLSMTRALIGGYRRPPRSELGKVRRVVFVCQGNICRSPYAEALLRDEGLPTVSCGLGANGVAPADQIAARVAYGRGIDLSGHCSLNVKDVDFRPGDLVLGMQPAHLSAMQPFVETHGICASLLGLWARPPRPWIEDPYGLAPGAFEDAFDIIEESIARLGQDLAHLYRS
ncbi:arsenate reductase/protein-tyrosine-phosphatase family protein [Lentisalinibacter sediminis]|uniref:arsenate reductase/protein-tyrosine-phosphatase family protein n=1 Tax=Lentisalinibacter sediminis TaxID=2992237 RepID=UPI00386AFEAE